MAYSNPYALSRLSHGYSGYGGPTGVSPYSLYRPLIQPYSPYGPGGGYQPVNQVSPLTSLNHEIAPTFTGAVPGIRGVGGAPTVAGGGSTAHNAGQDVGAQKGGAGDLSSDPILKKAQAYASSASDQAAAAALAAKKQDLIRLGDPDMVQRTLGGRIRSYGKGPMRGQDVLSKTGKGYKYEGIQKAAGGNTFSTVKELGRWNDRAVTGINEARNKQGLFYSSTRSRDQGLQGEDLLRQKSKAYQDFQDAISAIEQQLLAQQQSIRQGLLNAEATSYYNKQNQVGS